MELNLVFAVGRASETIWEKIYDQLVLQPQYQFMRELRRIVFAQTKTEPLETIRDRLIEGVRISAIFYIPNHVKEHAD